MSSEEIERPAYQASSTHIRTRVYASYQQREQWQQRGVEERRAIGDWLQTEANSKPQRRD
jgi:hypothetical protein